MHAPFDVVHRNKGAEKSVLFFLWLHATRPFDHRNGPAVCEVCPGRERIREATGISERHLTRCLASLAAGGFLEMRRVLIGGRVVDGFALYRFPLHRLAQLRGETAKRNESTTDTHGHGHPWPKPRTPMADATDTHGRSGSDTPYLYEDHMNKREESVEERKRSGAHRAGVAASRDALSDPPHACSDGDSGATEFFLHHDKPVATRKRAHAITIDQAHELFTWHEQQRSDLLRCNRPQRIIQPSGSNPYLRQIRALADYLRREKGLSGEALLEHMREFRSHALAEARMALQRRAKNAQKLLRWAREPSAWSLSAYEAAMARAMSDAWRPHRVVGLFDRDETAERNTMPTPELTEDILNGTDYGCDAEPMYGGAS